MEGPTDAEVIATSLEDPPRFATVYDRHAATIFRFLVRRVGRDVAEELLGETFRVAFEARCRFEMSHASARPWLYGIATNLLAKQRRSEGRRMRALARLETERPRDVTAERAVSSADAASAKPALARAIASLPDGDRDALLLFAWEGLTYNEIGRALGIPIGTVRSRINRARARVREQLPPTGEQPLTEQLPPGSGSVS